MWYRLKFHFASYTAIVSELLERQLIVFQISAIRRADVLKNFVIHVFNGKCNDHVMRPYRSDALSSVCISYTNLSEYIALK